MNSMPHEEDDNKLVDQFSTRFRTRPDFLARAPGRVDLLGAHTDYNEGWVLPAAINRAAWLGVKASESDEVTIYAADLDQQVQFQLAEVESIKAARRDK